MKTFPHLVKLLEDYNKYRSFIERTTNFASGTTFLVKDTYLYNAMQQTSTSTAKSERPYCILGVLYANADDLKDGKRLGF
jgi:hypothetical protein